MDRRRFLLTSLAGAVAAPLAAEAQQAGKVYRIGVLSLDSPPAGSVLRRFRRACASSATSRGRNIVD